MKPSRLNENFPLLRPLRSFQPRFSLSELLPEESERVFTEFSVAGLDVLDSLPPLSQNTIGTRQREEEPQFVSIRKNHLNSNFNLHPTLFIFLDPECN